MTPFWEELKTSGRIQKTREDRKSTSSQDDDFGGILEVQKPRLPKTSAQARPANCRVSVSTLIFSPSLIKTGTRISMPVSNLAGLVTLPLAVSPRTARFGIGNRQLHLGRQL